MRNLMLSFCVVSAGLGLGLVLDKAQAQITPDGTLSTTVTQSSNTFTIDQGNRVGNNLFHSFGQFSVPTGGAAIFNNTADVQNIFSRVMGGSVSNIDGVIRANGSANLFLLNPSGILFGPNASLNIGGSFVGTTANSIKFADGVEFSAVNPTMTPLLTVSVPIGLQLGQNPGAITIQGIGGHLTANDPIFSTYRSRSSSSLQVSSRATLALVGGQIEIQGGRLNAGHIAIGAIAPSSDVTPMVGLQATAQGLGLSYGNIPQFADIRLSQAALLDANNGSIQIQGRNVTFLDGSAAWTHNQSVSAAGTIDVTASGLLFLQGTTAQSNIRSGLESQALGTGKGGDIRVSANDITILDGAGIVARSFSAGDTGNITIQAKGDVQVRGFAPESNTNSIIGNFTVGLGNVGNVQLTANQLTLVEGGNATTATFGSGGSGKITVNVVDSIEIGGANPRTRSVSAIGGISFGSGNAGSVVVTTGRLRLRDAGRVTSGGFAQGNAGSVVVVATESIELSGDRTAIDSPIDVLPVVTRAVFGLPPIPSGSAGNVSIYTSLLKINDQAQVSVRNDGAGNAGNLQIYADQIELDRSAAITAATQSGGGGNIILNLQSLLSLRNQSTVTTNSGGVGNGGNIIINAPLIVGFENSDIIANAVQGRGGNIQITTQGIFGLQFRPQLTPKDDITASSQFGVNGTVQVNTIGTDPSAGLVELPENLTDSSRQIVAGCAGVQGNQFVITGRGGVPNNPMQVIRHDRPWADVRDPLTFHSPTPSLPHSPTPPVTEATTWQHNPDGGIELVAIAPSNLSLTHSAICAAAVR
jgi:filamentous hemagglutinin family protein